MIFAFAVGMQNVWFRISKNKIETASMIGEKEYGFYGDAWFACKYNHESLKDIIELAYEYANNA